MTVVAALQMTSSHDIDANLATTARLLKHAAEKKAALAVLPENFALMRKEPEDVLKIKETLGQGKIQDFLAEQARKYRMWLVGGTIPITTEDPNKIYATSLVFDDQGNSVAHYDKMHLFDVIIGKEEHHESKLITHGKHPVLVDTPFGKIGLAVCYDIRFPELFRYYFANGAEIFVLPTAFTVPTGQAHWEALTRARAIENFSYLIAACQTGTHTNGRSTYGHSMIIDPWGKILASLPEGEGIITAELDLHYLHEVREKMPVFKHRREL